MVKGQEDTFYIHRSETFPEIARAGKTSADGLKRAKQSGYQRRIRIPKNYANLERLDYKVRYACQFNNLHVLTPIERELHKHLRWYRRTDVYDYNKGSSRTGPDEEGWLNASLPEVYTATVKKIKCVFKMVCAKYQMKEGRDYKVLCDSGD